MWYGGVCALFGAVIVVGCPDAAPLESRCEQGGIACDPADEGTDAGQMEESRDAGFGDVDAGYPDGGAEAEEPDSGTPPEPDAGPAPCIGDAVAAPYTCPPGIDVCDPAGDEFAILDDDPEPRPTADILAAASRVEGDVLVLDLRFSAPPFTASFNHHVAIFLRVDDDIGTDDIFGNYASSEGEVFISADMLVDLVYGYPPGSHVPITFREAATENPPLVDIDICSMVLTSPDGYFLQMRMPILDPFSVDQVSYLVESQTSVGAYIDHVPQAPLFVTSTGGSLNDDWLSICDAPCPLLDDGT